MSNSGSMKDFSLLFARLTIMAVLLSGTMLSVNCQVVIPEVLTNGTLREQMDFINEKTRIYEDYRAIREDMFQKIRSNALDSLKVEKQNVALLKSINTSRNRSIDSLNSALESAKQDLDRLSRTKNSISLLGLELNKTTYNSIVWAIIITLGALLAIGLLAFKRNLSVTSRAKKDLEDLQKEFEAYRKAAREAREKMSMAHFNEVRKLRGV